MMGIPQTPASEGPGRCWPAWLLGGGGMGRGWDFLFGVTAARPPVLVVVTGTLFIAQTGNFLEVQ